MSPSLHMTRGEDGDIVDGYISPLPDDSDNEETNNLIGTERSLDGSRQDDPNEAAEAYHELNDLEIARTQVERRPEGEGLGSIGEHIAKILPQKPTESQ